MSSGLDLSHRGSSPGELSLKTLCGSDRSHAGSGMLCKVTATTVHAAGNLCGEGMLSFPAARPLTG